MSLSILDQHSIETITGRKRWSAQIRVLQKLGIDVIVRPDGKPIVSERHMAERMGEKCPGGKLPEVELNLEGINK